MFFPWLRLLKASDEFTDTDIAVFDEVLAQIYRRGYFSRFNPRVYKYFGLSLNESKWIQMLDKLTESALLRKNFELCHPVEGNTLQLFERMSDIPLGETITIAGEEDELYITESDVHITYSFADDFKPDSVKVAETIKPKKFFEGTYDACPQNEDKSELNLAEEMRLYPERVLDRAVFENIDRLRDLLRTIKDPETAKKTPKEKGDLLEDLSEVLLNSPYCQLHGRNVRTSTSELDLVFTVKRLQETLFGSFSDLLIVECKNWSSKMDGKAVSAFANKMDEVKSKTGIIFSKQGITGRNNECDAKGIIQRKWTSKEQIIMVFNLEDLTSVIQDRKNFYTLLNKRFHDVRLL